MCSNVIGHALAHSIGWVPMSRNVIVVHYLVIDRGSAILEAVLPATTALCGEPSSMEENLLFPVQSKVHETGYGCYYALLSEYL